MKTVKSIYEDSLDEVHETPLDIVASVTKDYSKSEFHPKYEQAGLWARGFIKQYIGILIMYGIFGAIYGFVYSTGGYPALIISISLTILYTLRQKR